MPRLYTEMDAKCTSRAAPCPHIVRGVRREPRGSKAPAMSEGRGVVGIRRSRWLVAALTLALIAEQLPARLPLLGAAIPPQASAAGGFDAALVGESVNRITLQPGQSQQNAIIFQNTGTTTWLTGSATQVDFAVCVPAACDVASPNPTWNSGWLSPSRYATANASTVSPGQLANFVWNITVPTGTAPGVYAFGGDLIVDATGATI